MPATIVPNFLRIVFIAATLLVSGISAAAAQEATGAEIFEYGLYEIGPSLGEYAPPNLGYRHETIGDFRHIETTDKVMGRIGVAFGVRYRITGDPIGFEVPVRIIVRFPPQGLYNPQYRHPLLVDETEQIAILGEEGYSGISFDEQWEIEPGIWTVEFWSGERKLGEKQFEVITPPVS